MSPVKFLAQRDARLLLATRLTSQTADGAQQAALATFVLLSPESRSTALAVAVGFSVLLLPYSVLGPFAGVLLDVWSRRAVLVTANTVRALGALGIAWQLSARTSGWGLGISVLLVLGLGRFVLAGLSAGLPHVVEREHLVAANSAFPTAGTLFAAAGTLLTASLLALAPASSAALAEVAVAGGYLGAAALASCIPRDRLGPESRDATQPPHLRSLRQIPIDLVSGLSHLASRPAAWHPMLVVINHRIAFGALTICGLFIARWQATTGEALGEAVLLAGGAGFGALVAALAAPRTVRRVGAARSSSAALILALSSPAFYAAAHATADARWLLPGGATIGFAGQWVKIAADTALQVHVSDGNRGRIFTIFDIGLNAGLVAGIWLAALFIPPHGYSTPVMIGVGGVLLVSAWLAYRSDGADHPVKHRPNVPNDG